MPQVISMLLLVSLRCIEPAYNLPSVSVVFAYSGSVLLKRIPAGLGSVLVLTRSAGTIAGSPLGTLQDLSQRLP